MASLHTEDKQPGLKINRQISTGETATASTALTELGPAVLCFYHHLNVNLNRCCLPEQSYIEIIPAGMQY